MHPVLATTGMLSNMYTHYSIFGYMFATPKRIILYTILFQ